MSNTNSTGDVTRNATSTLVWRMQRMDAQAWEEAVRRTSNGCSKPKAQRLLLAAIDAYEAKLPTPEPTPAIASVPAVRFVVEIDGESFDFAWNGDEMVAA